MQGKSLQFLPDGKMNNVDLRDGFKLGGERVVLVTASDRTQQGGRDLSPRHCKRAPRQCRGWNPGDRPLGSIRPVHVPKCEVGPAICVCQRSGRSRPAMGTGRDARRQGSHQAGARHKFGSQTEGCVADDRSGTLYVGEEDIGLWRVAADPVRGAAPVAVDKVAANPKIKDDIEGVGIYDLGGGRGYIVASSQGNNSYAVYRREGDHAYLGSFSVIADPAKGIDGISETDGLEVTSANLGPGFEHGAMIAQDGRNVMPAENQNFKMVPWAAIAAALNLEVRR